MAWSIGDNDALCSVPNNSCTVSMLYVLNFLAEYLGYSYDSKYTTSEYKGEDTYDFIVVGGGTAGCVIANRLSEINEWTVLLLEKGDEEPIITQVPGLNSFLKGSTITKTFSTQPEPNACGDQDNHACTGSRGILLGGSSAVLQSYLTRGNKLDYNNWANMGNEGWSWDDVLPYFTKSENIEISNLKDSKYHGKRGYLNVEESEFYDHYDDVILEAWKELGLDIIDYNSGDNSGASKLQYSQVNGAYQSTNTAYIRPIRGRTRPNLVVRTNATVTKIIIDPKTKKATGVECQFQDSSEIIHTRQEVILSAGSVESPKLLMLSGIGPEENLKEAGIEVIMNLPVGENLHNHFGIELLKATFKDTNGYYITANFVNDAIHWLSSHKGKLSSSSHMDAIAFLQTSFEHQSNYPDIMVTFNKFKYLLNISEYHSFSYYDGFNVQVTNLANKSRGTLKLNTSDPMSAPVIHANFMTNPDDLKTLIEGARMAAKLAETEAFKRAGFTTERPSNDELCNNVEYKTDEYYGCMAQNHTKITANLVGTCKMGPEGEKGSVVDSELKVHGIEGLRVMDESIMPVIPRGLIIWPTIMIAEKGTNLIKRDHHKETFLY